ncbi:MAG: 3-isopropylmalate dehydratase small subunit [Clostridia bacterium]|nr:3-isopropylmalate dehydratase small subunit [Clostridia bacterium]
MKIYKYGDDVNTDLIIPARYLNIATKENLAAHCMEDIDLDFAKTVEKGDILIAGKNFGCGSSREHAPMAIKACGVNIVIAESFARIFYRNAINIGLYIIECPEAAKEISVNDDIDVDVKTGTIIDKTTNKKYVGTAFPDFIQKIVEKGGLLNCISDFGGKNE